MLNCTCKQFSSQPGPASQHRMQVGNMFTVNFMLCPLNANSWSLESTSCNRNEAKQCINTRKVTEVSNSTSRYVDIRWPNSALRIPNYTPNSKPHSDFLNLTPNSKNSLRIQKTHSELKKLTPNSKNSLRIKNTHSEFKKLTPNSKSPLRILKTHSDYIRVIMTLV